MRTSFLLVIFFIVFSSCNSDDVSTEQSKLNSARDLWKSHKIVNYKWNERLSCECGGSLERTVTVINGDKSKVDFDESLLFDGYTYDDVLKASNTVEESFVFIERLLNKNVASLTIEYNKEFGYPTLISVDYDKDTIDDEIIYYYSNLEFTSL